MSEKIVCFGVRDVEIEYFHKLNNFGYELELVSSGLNDQSVLKVENASAVMVRGNCQANRKNLEYLAKKGVKIVLTRTVGFNHVDLEAAKELGMKVARVPSYSPNAISELAVTLAMMLLRHTAYTVKKTSERDFTVDAKMFSKEVRNCTVGVLGVGRIGYTTAKLFHGLGAKVLGFDVYQNEEAKKIVDFKSMDDVLAESDIISVHLPFFKDQNYHIINDDFLSKMKDGAILVNTARGQLQDNEAILKALKSGKLAGFGTDVFEGESSFFFKNLKGTKVTDETVEELVQMYPKVLITPHIGSYTDQALTNMIEISYQNMNEFLTEGKSKNQLA
ncbi:lactate dehydrogenase [Mycoplasmatota bacterium]|nr:lactate dehydrogenase [Mycoplasmatota bacterium]